MGDLLFKDGVCAGQHFTIHEQIPPTLSSGFHLLISPQTRVIQTMIKLRRQFRMRTPLVMRHHLLHNLAIVNHPATHRRTVHLGERALQAVQAPDGVLVLDVERVALGADPLLAVLVVDDVGHGGQQLADLGVVERGDVQAREGRHAGLALADFQAELGEAGFEEVDAGPVLGGEAVDEVGVVGDGWLRM